MSQKIKKINEEKLKTVKHTLASTLIEKYLWMECPLCGCEMKYNTIGFLPVNIGDGPDYETVPGMLFYKGGPHKKGCKWGRI